MEYDTKYTRRKGLNFLTTLGLLYITLYLMGYIKFHLFWVLSPFIADFVITGIVRLAQTISGNYTETNTRGMTTLRWLTVIFVGMFYTGYINWHPFWVVLPILTEMFLDFIALAILGAAELIS